MALALVLHELADAEALDAYDWYAAGDLAVAEKFRSALLEAMDQITERPELSPPFDGSLRRRLLDGFPYLLEEYCYGDDDALASILGNPLVPREASDSRGRLIPLDEPSAVISALLQSFEGLATAPDAIAADDVPEAPAGQDDAGDDDDETDEAASAVS